VRVCFCVVEVVRGCVRASGKFLVTSYSALGFRNSVSINAAEKNCGKKPRVFTARLLQENLQATLQLTSRLRDWTAALPTRYPACSHLQ